MASFILGTLKDHTKAITMPQHLGGLRARTCVSHYLRSAQRTHQMWKKVQLVSLPQVAHRKLAAPTLMSGQMNGLMTCAHRAQKSHWTYLLQRWSLNVKPAPCPCNTRMTRAPILRTQTVTALNWTTPTALMPCGPQPPFLHERHSYSLYIEKYLYK